MARKIKFALEMTDGFEARDIDDLREHFNLDKITKYFHTGQLVEWLEDRYYEEEAETLRSIDREDPNLAQKICAVFKINYIEASDPEFVKRVKEKKFILQQKTKATNIINNARITALTQEDLADLLDYDEPIIYLCGEKFNVPIRVENKKYVGILSTPKIIIKANSKADLDEKNISFTNCQLPSNLSKSSETGRTSNTSSRSNSQSNSQSGIKVSGDCAQANVVIRNNAGLHARPASLFVQTACRYKSKIQIKAKGKTVDAKSILMIMSLGLAKGDQFSITANGSDAFQAVKALKELVDSGFGAW